MKRYNPNKERSIMWNISNSIDWIFNRIMIENGEDPFDIKWNWMKFELSKDKTYDDVIEKIISTFFKENRKIYNNISIDVLDHIRDNWIIPILESNLEHESIEISKATIDRIVQICQYSFIMEFRTYDDLEVDEDEYLSIKYRYINVCLDKIVSSNDGINKIELWFEQQLDDKWKLHFRKIWLEYIEKHISTNEMLKKAFKIFGECNFIDNILDRNPLIEKCRRSNSKEFDY